MLPFPFKPGLNKMIIWIFQPVGWKSKPGFRNWARIFSPGWSLFHVIATYILREFLSEPGLKSQSGYRAEISAGAEIRHVIVPEIRPEYKMTVNFSYESSFVRFPLTCWTCQSRIFGNKLHANLNFIGDQFALLFVCNNIHATKEDRFSIIPNEKITTIKDQKSADAVKKQLSDLSNKIDHTLQPVFNSRKILEDLKMCEPKPSIISQQCVVYNHKCDLCDAEYVSYTSRHLHQRKRAIQQSANT